MSAKCSTDATLTITDSAQATALSSCTTFTGSIAVGNSFKGQLALNNVNEITGTFTADSAPDLTSFSALMLQSVDGIHINDSSALTLVAWPALHIVKDQILISGTSLGSLEMQLLNTTTTVMLLNNSQLTTARLSGLTAADEVLVQYNGNRTLTLDLAGLQQVTHLTIAQCLSVDLSSLSSVGDASFGDSTFTNLSFPALTEVLGGLSIFANGQLESLSAPLLTTVEVPDDATAEVVALTFTSDTDLMGPLEFPALQNIKHSATITGTFSKFLLPALKTFSGKLRIDSTGNISSTCNHFKDLSAANYTIFTASSTVNCTYPTSLPSHNNSHRTKGIVGGVTAAVVFVVVAGLLCVCFTFRRIRRKGFKRELHTGSVERENVELDDYKPFARGGQ